MSDSFRDGLADLLSEHDVQLKVEVLDGILELFEEHVNNQGGEQWSNGHNDGFIAGLESAKKTALAESGAMFARNNDDFARFLRIFANETMTKQIADAKKRLK